MRRDKATVFMQETPAGVEYDLSAWDYRVRNSGIGRLDITVEKEGEGLADVSLTDEEITIFRKRSLTDHEEKLLHLFLEDLLWTPPFSEFAHLGTLRVVLETTAALKKLLLERFQDELLYIRFNDEEDFMGYLEQVNIRQSDDCEQLQCYFEPVDDDADLIQASVVLNAGDKATASAHAVKINGVDAALEIARHVEHQPVNNR